jgi:N-acetylglutamate synthase-like GNAT family acetyltransferase
MIVIREALSTDNAGLLQLTSVTPMKGQISIRIDRNPDFFSLLRMRGHSKTIVAEENGTIVGCFSVSNIETLVNGTFEKVYYLADLKIHPLYAGKTLAGRLLNKMEANIRKAEADLLFCTAAFGNEKVMPLFGGRARFPKFRYTGTFRVLQIIPLARTITSDKYKIMEVVMNDDIIEFYNQFYSRYHFAPKFSESTLSGTRTIAVLYNNCIKASVSLIDVSSSKQNVLTGLPFFLNCVVSGFGLLNRIFHVINLPKIGSPVKILYIKAFAFRDGNEDALDLLIQHSRKLAFLEKYCYLTVGIHEKDPLVRFFDKYLHFTFKSMGFILSMQGNTDKVNRICNGVLFEDYSLV